MPTPTSPQFKLWFRGSKITEGKQPLVVYHGTKYTFSTFDREKSGKGPSKLGFWFTDDPEFAGNFGTTKMACYLNISRPKMLSQSKWNAVRGEHGGDVVFFSAMREKLIQEGYDGIVVKPTEEKLGRFTVRNPGFYAAFYPYQIKSVNSRNWDTEKADIYENPRRKRVKLRRNNSVPSTTAFKKWFGKSKVKTKDGAPLPMHHGSNSQFFKIDTKTWGKGNDQDGPGFYLTSNAENTQAYGNHRIDVYARVEKPLVKGTNKKLTPAQVQALIKASPDYAENIENWGDISYLGEARVLRDAVAAYGRNDAFNAIQSIYNDFWGDPVAYLKAVTRITGYDGVWHQITPKDLHIVVWSPNQVKFVSNDGAWSREDDDMRKNPRRRRK